MNLQECKIITLEFDFSKKKWSKSIIFKTNFEVPQNIENQEEILLAITQKIFNIEEKSKPIFKMKLLGLFKSDYVPDAKTNYDKQFYQLYNVYIDKVNQLNNVIDIKFPPIPKWDDLKSK